MKPARNNHDAEKIDWFLSLLNAGREPETSVADRRKPERKENRPEPMQPFEEQLRADVGTVMGEIVSRLAKVTGPLDESDRRALWRLAANQPSFFDGTLAPMTLVRLSG